MSGLAHWVRFNVVGVAGMVVQLGVLAGMHRVLGGHVLAATAVAIECTLLCNFVGHVQWTWRDRDVVWRRALLRFHLSNGVISMGGNLVLMHVLAERAHLPVVAANVVAIGCCSVVNFFAGEWWAFAGKGEHKGTKGTEVAQREARMGGGVCLGR